MCANCFHVLPFLVPWWPYLHVRAKVAELWQVTYPSALHWVRWAAAFWACCCCGTAEWKAWVSKQAYSYSFSSWALLISSTSHPLFLAKDGPELASVGVPNAEVLQLGLSLLLTAMRAGLFLWEQQRHSHWAQVDTEPSQDMVLVVLLSEDHNNILPKLFWELTKKIPNHLLRICEMQLSVTLKFLPLLQSFLCPILRWKHNTRLQES